MGAAAHGDGARDRHVGVVDRPPGRIDHAHAQPPVHAQAELVALVGVVAEEPAVVGPAIGVRHRGGGEHHGARPVRLVADRGTVDDVGALGRAAAGEADAGGVAAAAGGRAQGRLERAPPHRDVLAVRAIDRRRAADLDHLADRAGVDRQVNPGARARGRNYFGTLDGHLGVVDCQLVAVGWQVGEGVGAVLVADRAGLIGQYRPAHHHGGAH